MITLYTDDSLSRTLLQQMSGLNHQSDMFNDFNLPLITAQRVNLYFAKSLMDAIRQKKFFFVHVVSLADERRLSSQQRTIKWRHKQTSFFKLKFKNSNAEKKSQHCRLLLVTTAQQMASVTTRRIYIDMFGQRSLIYWLNAAPELYTSAVAPACMRLHCNNKFNERKKN